jgi:hypothetical protein
MLDGYKTYIGILFTIVGAAASTFHWSFGAMLPDIQGQLVTLVGAGLAIYGRAVAKPV